MMLYSPCINCTKREYKCHGTCNKYKLFKIHTNWLAKKRRKEIQLGYINKLEEQRRRRRLSQQQNRLF